MLIVNGMRRRTPGGVFLFLLKNCDDISKKQKKDIFLEETRKTIKSRKISQALKRDLEVEELKKSLKCENELPVLGSRSDLLASSTSHLHLDTHVNLSNPPPSPVTDCNRENSSDFDSHSIQHMVNVTSPEKGTFDLNLIRYIPKLAKNVGNLFSIIIKPSKKMLSIKYFNIFPCKMLKT